MGLLISERRLCAKGEHAGDGCRVTDFNMAGSHDPADCQHVQRVALLLLVRSPQLYVLDRRREDVHRVFFCIEIMGKFSYIQSIRPRSSPSP